MPTALAKLRELSQPLGGILGQSGSARTVDVNDVGNGVIRLSVSQVAINDYLRKASEQSVAIIEKRINALGTV